MHRTAATPRQTPSFVGRLAELLAATDQALAWWGEHRGWPANDPIRVRCSRKG